MPASQVVNRLEDIAMQRLQKQQAEQQAEQQAAADAAAADAAASAAEEAEAAAEAAKEQQQQQEAAAEAAEKKAAEEAAETAAAAAAAAKAAADARAVQPTLLHDTCPTCQQPNVRTGYGGLARALSVAAREAAAGGAAADAAAAAHYQHLLQRAAAAVASSGAAAGVGASAAAGAAAPTPGMPAMLSPGVSFTARQHTYEVLIQNDDDPITAEAVAHTLNQYESGSLSKVLAGHPQALQQLHQLQQQEQQRAGAAAQQLPVRGPSGATLSHSLTAPVHSRLLDTAAEVAAAAVAAGTVEPAAAGAAAGGSVPVSRVRSRDFSSSGGPTSPINIVGAVSRSNIELLPAQGPGMVPCSSAAVAPAAAAGLPLGNSIPAAAAAAPSSAPGSGAPGGWYLASGSSFKKGMWLEKRPAVEVPGAQSLGVPDGQAGTKGGTSGTTDSTVTASAAAGTGATSCPPLSPLLSPIGSQGQGLPDAGSLLQGSFSLQLRREAAVLPAVAEDIVEGAAGEAAAAAAPAGRQVMRSPRSLVGSLPADWEAGGVQQGRGDVPAAAAAGLAGGSTDPAAAAAARMLRRQTTTRRLGTDVLAAAGALSKALSAFSSASQALPAAAVGAAAAAADGSTPAATGTNLLLTPDFVAAARGLSEALAALLPSAAALADVEPDQGAAAAAAASEAIAGLKTLQGQMAAAAAAARAGPGSSREAARGAAAETAAGTAAGGGKESAFAASSRDATVLAASPRIEVPAVNIAKAINIPSSNSSRGTSTYSVWGAEGTSGEGAEPVLDGSVVSLNSFSFSGLYGGGSMINRRSSGDANRRSSAEGNQPCTGAAAAAAAAAAVGSAIASASVPQSSPVLLRMPSMRHSAELRRP